MTPGERRVLVRALILLTLAGLGRVAMDARRPPADVLADRPDAAAALDSAATALAAENAARSRPLAPGERLDPNRASEMELDRLPGVGPALAARIVRDRDERGGFAAVGDLARVPGIGAATVARLEPHLALRAPAPPPRASRATGTRPSTRGVPEGALPLVDVNRADSAALLEVGGIGPALAGRILEFRRRRGRVRRLEELLEVRGIGERTLERLRRRLVAGSGA